MHEGVVKRQQDVKNGQLTRSEEELGVKLKYYYLLSVRTLVQSDYILSCDSKVHWYLLLQTSVNPELWSDCFTFLKYKRVLQEKLIENQLPVKKILLIYLVFQNSLQLSCSFKTTLSCYVL